MDGGMIEGQRCVTSHQLTLMEAETSICCQSPPLRPPLSSSLRFSLSSSPSSSLLSPSFSCSSSPPPFICLSCIFSLSYSSFLSPLLLSLVLFPSVLLSVHSTVFFALLFLFALSSSLSSFSAPLSVSSLPSDFISSALETLCCSGGAVRSLGSRVSFRAVAPLLLRAAARRSASLCPCVSLH